MDSPKPTRWQFSLLRLFIVTTLVAVILAFKVKYPKLALGIGIVVGVAAALHVADRFLASIRSPLGGRLWSLMIVTAWMTAGMMFIFFMGLTLLLHETSVSSINAVPLWPVLTPIFCGAIYCFFAAGKAVDRSRKRSTRDDVRERDTRQQ